jgi:hypothetical protein
MSDSCVVDDETGIDRDGAFRAFDHNGVRMAADAAVAFVDRHFVLLAEQPGRRHAGNTGADDRYVLWDGKIAVHRSPLGRIRRPRLLFLTSPHVAVTLGRRRWITGAGRNQMAGD